MQRIHSSRHYSAVQVGQKTASVVKLSDFATIVSATGDTDCIVV